MVDPFMESLKPFKEHKGIYDLGENLLKFKGDPRNVFRFEDYKGKTKEEKKQAAIGHAAQHSEFYEKLVRAGYLHPKTKILLFDDKDSVAIALVQPKVDVPEHGFKFESITDAQQAARLRQLKAKKLEALAELMEQEGAKPHGDWQHEFNWGYNGKGLYYIDSSILLEKLPLKRGGIIGRIRKKK